MTDEPSDRPLRVLVVDDDDVDRLAVRRGLARGGVDVTVDEASAVADALSRIAAARYDCIFLDYTLPGGDGLSLLESLRDAGLDAPVVMLTGQGDEQVAVQLMKAGAADYLPKSAATPERLAAAVRYAVELSRAQTHARTAEKELRASVARSRFLAEASATLAGSLDVRATLDRIAALSVPILGEYCLIYLNGGDGVAAVASAHHDPAKAGFARTIARDFRPEPIHPVSGIIDVMRTGQTRVIDPISPEFLDQLSATIELRDAFRALAPTASLFVPMIARDVMGTIVFSRDASREHFTAADISLAEDLARRAAAALDNARLFEAAEHARSRT
ncbi:MAG: response regulator, partial [Gemmatimonadaceae bacterium]